MLLSKFLFCILILFASTLSSAKSLGFICKSNTTSKCKSLAGYVSPNATTLSRIVSLFGLTDFNLLLGANNLPRRTKPSKSVAAKETIKIPFTCSCKNGTGISDKGPIYKVQSGDTLYHIATDLFGFLVTTDEIAAANNISNSDLIDVDQLLQIPLPCNCDVVDGNRVLHYAHKVSPNRTLEMIAKEFGATEESLLTLNNLTDAKQLEADSILDVPLRGVSPLPSTHAWLGKLGFIATHKNGSYKRCWVGCFRFIRRGNPNLQEVKLNFKFLIFRRDFVILTKR